MIKNTKGNKSYTRPLPIRMLAILMAVVMVLSVLYINNSKGKVEAADASVKEVTGLPFEKTLLNSAYDTGDFFVEVPAAGVRVLLNNSSIGTSTETINVSNIYAKKSDLESNEENDALPDYIKVGSGESVDTDKYDSFPVSGTKTTDTSWYLHESGDIKLTDTQVVGENNYFYVDSAEDPKIITKRTIISYEFSHDLPARVSELLGEDYTNSTENISTVNIRAFKTNVDGLTINVNSNSKTIVVNDSDVSSYALSENIITGCIKYIVFKDGEKKYELTGPEGLESLSDILNDPSSSSDGSYTIRRVIQPVVGGSIDLADEDKFVKEIDIERNFYTLTKVTATPDGGSPVVDAAAPFELTVPSTGKANPSKDINVVFETDEKIDTSTIRLGVDEGSFTVITELDDTLAAEATEAPYIYSFDIHDDFDNLNGKKITYNVAMSTNTETDKFSLVVDYADGKPQIEKEKIGADDWASVKYIKDSSITISADAYMDSEYATLESVDVYNATSTGTISGDPIGACTMNGRTASFGLAYSETPENSTLNPGHNYYKMRATSNLSLYRNSKLFDIFYDDNAPQIISVSLKNTGDTGTINGTIGDQSVSFEKKVTSQKDVELWFTFGDKQKDGTSDGSKLADNGVSQFEFNGKKYDCEWHGTADFSIPADDIKEAFLEGGNGTGTLTITDNAGNSAEYTVTVPFFNEKATITSTLTPTTTGDKKYFVWETPTSPSARVDYEISSEVPLNTKDFTINGSVPTGAPASLTPATAAAAYNEETKKYEYKYSFNFDCTASAELENIILEVKNINNVPSDDKIDIVGIDVTKPTQTTNKDDQSKDDEENPIWHKDKLELIVTVDDGQYTSGINSIVVTGTDNDTPTLTNGQFTAIVNQSADANGTPVTISTSDNAGNVSDLYNKTFYVDLTAPVVELRVGGKKYDEVNGKVLQGNPAIEFSWNDTISGLDGNQKITVDGHEWTDPAMSGESLKKFLGLTEADSLDPKHDYAIKIEAYDVAGNKTVYETSFRIDDAPPTITGNIDTTAINKEKYPTFFNKDVQLTVTVTDSNIDTNGLKVEDTLGHSLDVKWDPISGGYKGTIIAKDEGPYNVKVVATDKGTLSSNWSKSFTIDKTIPDITTKLNGETYTGDDAFVTSASTTSDLYEINKDEANIKTTIERVSPEGAKTSETKDGFGPFSLTDDGKYTVTYKSVDKAGNPSEKTIKFTVDNSKPVHNMYITTADPAKVARFNNTYSNKVGKFSGHSDQEEYTYGQYYNTDVSIDFSFFDYNIKSAQVTDNGSVLPVNWSFNGPYGKGSYTISSEGYHEIVFSSTDHSDNTTTDSGANQKLRFTIDKSAPTISTSLNGVRYSEGSGVRYFNTNGTIDVSVSDANIDGSDLNRINRMTVPGSSVSVSEASVGEGAETFSTEADYEVQYYAIDRAGNRSDTRTVMFRVDKTAPQLQVSNVGAVSTAGSQNVSFNVKEAFFSDMNNVTIKIYKRVEGRAEVLEKTIDFKPNSANDSTSYTFSEDAEYRIEFTAEDKCGNKSNTDYSFIKDGTAPLITLSGVSNYDKTDKNVELTVIIDEAFYSSNRVTLSGTRTDINGKSNAITFDSFVTNRSKISQLQQLFKEDGIYDITVTSTDKAGNSSSKGVHFTIDTTDPVIGDLSKYDGIRTNSFKWDTNLDELVTDLTVCDIKVYMDGSLYDGTSDVEDGSHVLKIEATDELGHTTTKEVTFVLDSRGPNIIISNVEDGDNLLDSTEVIVTVELDEDSLDTVMLNDKAVEVKDNQAKLTVNKKGKYTLSATAHDEAGNASSAEIKFTFGKQTNLLLIGIIAGILILLLLALLVIIRRRKND